MEFEYITNGVSLDDSLREYVRQRLCSHALLNAGRIASITVRLGQDLENSDALKWHCAVTVRLRFGRTLTAIGLGGDPRATIDRVVTAAVSVVRRQSNGGWWRWLRCGQVALRRFRRSLPNNS